MIGEKIDRARERYVPGAGNAEVVNSVATTGDIKQELCSQVAIEPHLRRAELIALLRFAGGLKVVGGQVVIEAELDAERVVQRLGRGLVEVFHVQPIVREFRHAGRRRFLVRVPNGERLGRHTGLLDQRGRPMLGLSPGVVSGGLDVAAAAVRGAFLAAGALYRGHRQPVIEIECPGPAAAVALSGMARRLDFTAKNTENNGTDHIEIRGTDAIITLLTRIGAVRHARALGQAQPRCETPPPMSSGFNDANRHRAALAAADAAARAGRAIDILGDTAAEHLVTAGRLRVAHPDVPLSDLGMLAEPPLSKDAIAGRIRRLILAADQHAHRLGIPDTESAASQGSHKPDDRHLQQRDRGR